MPQTAVEPSYLVSLTETSELEGLTMLGSPASPHTAEAMNAILLQDGIHAYIGTRFELGALFLQLNERIGKGTERCWTSSLVSSAMTTLGLSRNTLVPEGRLPVFHGNRRVKVLENLIRVQYVCLFDDTFWDGLLSLLLEGGDDRRNAGREGRPIFLDRFPSLDEFSYEELFDAIHALYHWCKHQLNSGEAYHLVAQYVDCGLPHSIIEPMNSIR